MSLLQQGDQNWTEYFTCGLTSAKKRRRILYLILLGTLFPKQPRRLLAFFTTSTGCWLMVSLSTRATRSFPGKLLSSWSYLHLGWCLWLLLPRCWALLFPSMNFMNFPLTQNFGSSDYGSTTVQCINHCYQFCLGFNFTIFFTNEGIVFKLLDPVLILDYTIGKWPRAGVCNTGQLFEPNSSASFLSTSLATYLVCASSDSRRYYGNHPSFRKGDVQF